MEKARRRSKPVARRIGSGGLTRQVRSRHEAHRGAVTPATTAAVLLHRDQEGTSTKVDTRMLLEGGTAERLRWAHVVRTNQVR